MTPLFALTPTFENRDGRCWLFDESATAVDQILTSEMNDDAAAFLTGPYQLAVNTRFVSQGRKVRYVHDWRSCERYTPAAREKLLEWGRQGHSMTAETIIVISPHASAFVRIALSTATMVMRGLRMKIEVRDSLDSLVAELGSSRVVTGDAVRGV